MMDEKQISMMAIGFDQTLKPLANIFDLSGKVALVTGGATGLGFSITRRLAEAGAKVVIASRNVERGGKSEGYFRSKGYDVTYFQGDVITAEGCKAIVDFTVDHYGDIDICVPAAAVWSQCAFVDMTADEYDRILDTNTKGQYFTVQEAARAMIKKGHGGHICMISSVAHNSNDVAGIGMMTHYNASKGALVSTCLGIAKELRQYGIVVNCVAPGAMVTAGALSNGAYVVQKYGSAIMDEIMKYSAATPLSKTPDEVALMVFCMCTQVADFMVGFTVDVDGGSQLSLQQKPWSVTMTEECEALAKKTAEANKPLY